ncbi:T9SS type A sorting domain-containing protein [Adhaeribacter swui]|uniref:T9SS type A sorting domain-containing protein n=1 Tax=Adhaeribacter swui TaxID=2086471 RepID=A0A7G7G4P3_9BACT|nr:T9SS type A sorting domain-containing protein [Adhaeribacter swui]QNF32127.1 T9SS type A sorting domain-containing protein [Adhaeribacter swui]
MTSTLPRQRTPFRLFFFLPASWRLFLFLFFFKIFAFSVVAQPALVKKWDKTLGGTADDYLSVTVPTPDGGYLLGGTSYSTKSGDKTHENYGEADCHHNTCYFTSEDYWVIKIDADGQKVWDKTYGGRGSDQLKAMVALPEGGYLLGGISYSNTSGDKSANSKGYSDYWVIKIDLYGNKIWDRTYGGSSADDLVSILPTPDGGFLLGGTSFSGIEGDKTDMNRGENTSDYWLVKIDRNGTKQWDQTYGGSNTDYLTFLAATPDDQILVGGSSNSRVSADKTAPNKQTALAKAENTYNGWILKIDQRGHKQWDKTYGFSNRDNHLAAIYYQPETKKFIIGGSAAGLSLTDYDYDYLVAEIDATGNETWLTTYGGESNDFLSTIAPAPNGNFIIGGTSTSKISKNKTEKSRGYEDFWLVRLANTQKVWDKTVGSHSSDNLRSVLFTADGGYLLSGTSISGRGPDKSESSRGGRDFWVAKWQDAAPPAQEIATFRYGNSKNDNFTQIIKTGDNGYLLGGYSEPANSNEPTIPGRGGLDYWVVKTDASGKEEWRKRFGGPENDYLNSIMQTPDGGYLLGGSSESGVGGDKSGVSRGDRDFWVIKISRNGTKEWDRTFGGSGFEDLRQIRQFASGNYVLGGYSISSAGDDKSEDSRGGYDYWVVILNPRGNKIADYSFGGNAHDYLQDVLVNPDGSLLLGGTSVSGLSGDKSQLSQGGADYWIVKVSPDGQRLWDKCYGSSEQDHLSALAAMGDTYILAGYSNSPVKGNKTQNSQGGNDFWVIKINNQGQQLWDKTYGGNGPDELRSIAVTTTGSLLLGGTSASETGGDKSENSQGSTDYWLIKTNSAGAKQWDKRFGGSGPDELRTIVQANDDSYLLAGRSNSEISGDQTQPSLGLTDYWLVKVPESVITSPRYFIKPNSATLSTNEVKLLQAFPNPFQDKVTIRFSLPITQTATLRVLDSQGNEVTSLYQAEAQANRPYQLEWQADKQEAGLYFLQLQTSTGQSTHKILLQK